MRKTYSIFKRELAGYFLTPVAPIFIVVFIALSGIMTLHLGRWFENEQADLRPFFGFLPWMLLFLIPALSMRMWAEERKQGTIELLLTLPISMTQAVLGKFLAAWAFTGIVLALTANFWVTTRYLGDPDDGVILSSYLGGFFMAGSYLAVGSCLSALTRNQVIAFVLTVVVLFMNIVLGLPMALDFLRDLLPAALVDAIASLSFLGHFEAISKGVLDARDMLFFGTVIVLWLFANSVVLDLRKGS